MKLKLKLKLKARRKKNEIYLLNKKKKEENNRRGNYGSGFGAESDVNKNSTDGGQKQTRPDRSEAFEGFPWINDAVMVPIEERHVFLQHVLLACVQTWVTVKRLTQKKKEEDRNAISRISGGGFRITFFTGARGEIREFSHRRRRRRRRRRRPFSVNFGLGTKRCV